jgi:hypothetical protein
MDIETISSFEEVKPVFLYIPDISGFTKFIHDTNLSESKKLIHDLLEVILDANILNLKVAEIMGDAIVFYKTGAPPNLTKLESQTKKTFNDFQKAIKKLENENIFAKELHHLSLKIIVHYGEIATTEIKGIPKLIGSDLILAYRILKNNIKEHEYLLMTNQYLKTQKKDYLEKSFRWSEIKEGTTIYDYFETIDYKYIPLAPLREPIRQVY